MGLSFQEKAESSFGKGTRRSQVTDKRPPWPAVWINESGEHTGLLLKAPGSSSAPYLGKAKWGAHVWESVCLDWKAGKQHGTRSAGAHKVFLEHGWGDPSNEQALKGMSRNPSGLGGGHFVEHLHLAIPFPCDPVE